MGSYVDLPDALFVDDAGNEHRVDATCVVDRPPVGLVSWLGWGWAKTRMEPGAHTLRVGDWSTRVLVRRVREENNSSGRTIRVEFRGNGPAPDEREVYP